MKNAAGAVHGREPSPGPLRELTLTVGALAELWTLLDPLLTRTPPAATEPSTPGTPTLVEDTTGPRRRRRAPVPSAPDMQVRDRGIDAALPVRHRGRALVVSLRKPANVAFLVVLTVVLTAWWVELRPTTLLGGPATFITVKGTSMLPTLHTGDFVLAEAQPTYHAGDLVVYSVPRGNVGAGDDLIHRIVGGSAATGFTLKGDNNDAPDPWTVPKSDILGKETLVIPGAGNWLLTLHSPLFAGLVAALIAVWVVMSPPGWLRRRTPAAARPSDDHPTTGDPNRPTRGTGL